MLGEIYQPAGKRNLPARKQIRVDGEYKQYSHYVWFKNTGYWPVRGEIIHHIDGNCRNDEFSNLRLMTKAEHTRIHSIGKSYPNPTRAKMNRANLGEKHPCWKGDDATPQTK